MDCVSKAKAVLGGKKLPEQARVEVDRVGEILLTSFGNVGKSDRPPEWL